MDHVENLQFLKRLETPITLTPNTATMDDIAVHAHLRQRLSPGTIERNLRYLRFMEQYQPQEYAVNIRNPTLENYIRHMDYREQVEHAGYGALKHEHQAMRMLLRSYGIDPRNYPYRPPKQPQYRVRYIPNPEQLYHIFHLRYSTNPVENACIRYLVNHNILIGWRPPGEPSIATVDNVDLDDGMILITSDKLHGATRLLDIGEWCNRHQITSMKNWVDIWRPRIATEESRNYLYLHPDGRPFEKSEQLRMFLNRMANPVIKQVFPGWYNYLARHTNAIMRLIQTKVQTKHYDEYSVCEDMGHTKIQTTLDYIKDAKHYYKKWDFDWFSRVLKNHTDAVGDNTVKNDKPPENARIAVCQQIRTCTPPAVSENTYSCRFRWIFTLKTWLSSFKPSLSFLFFLSHCNGDGNPNFFHFSSPPLLENPISIAQYDRVGWEGNIRGLPFLPICMVNAVEWWNQEQYVSWGSIASDVLGGGSIPLCRMRDPSNYNFYYTSHPLWGLSRSIFCVGVAG